MFSEPCRRSYLWLSIRKSLILITFTICWYLSAVIIVHCKKKTLWSEVAGDVISGHRHNYLEGSLADLANQGNKSCCRLDIRHSILPKFRVFFFIRFIKTVDVWSSVEQVARVGAHIIIWTLGIEIELSNLRASSFICWAILSILSPFLFMTFSDLWSHHCNSSSFLKITVCGFIRSRRKAGYEGSFRPQRQWRLWVSP